MTTKRYDDEQWHDADYVGPERIVVADLARDRVFIANTSTGLITWEWQAHQAYDASSGGRTAQDWTHINDVEVLPDGRLMVSVRNHDQVIFIDPETGIEKPWTLGQDHSPESANKTLYEQHNPDYIPRRRGGPSVLVADSEHNRVVEFQRRGTNWTRTWEYNPGLNWPRDADRLPNGNTLITDSRDNEVIEVNRAGNVVWRRSVPLPYEAERFGSGPESTGGPSATSAGLEPASGSSGQAAPLVATKRYFPDRVVNAVSFALARYPISLVSLVAVAVAFGATVLWAILEWRRSDYHLCLPVTKR
nr:aryl-sulfate sulfotransferase [Halobellus ruber]